MKQKLDLSLRAIADNIVFSKNEVWAYYRADTTGYDFLNDNSKIMLLSNISQVFANMMANKDERIDMHVLITNTPVNIDHWEDQFLQITSSWKRKPGFNKYFAEQVEYLKMREFMCRRVYIGVKLMNRHEVTVKSLSKQLENGVGAMLSFIREELFTPVGANDYAISKKEIKTARMMETDFYNFFHGSELLCNRATTEELALVNKRIFYPSMPTPYLDVPAKSRWGKGDICRELGVDMVCRNRWLEITQPILGDMSTGYRATLSFTKFPDEMNVPGGYPWIYLTQKIGSPYDISARLTLIPNKKMKKEVNNQKRDLEDEANNMSEGHHNLSLDLQQDYNQAMQLEAYTAKNDDPWLEGTFRIVITDPDLENLKQDVEIIKNGYSTAGITLTWTAGDQVDLMLETMIGDHVRDDSFKQTSNVELIGASGFNIFDKVGDDDMKDA